MLVFLYILAAAQLWPAGAVPRAYRSRPKHSVTIVHGDASHQPEAPKLARKKKAPNMPLSISHHILVPNLHVIPIQHITHHTHPEYTHNVIINQNPHGNNHGNNTHTLIPVFIPIHNFPVHDLTVIPLHRVDTKINFDNDDRDRYRNPLGGYGAGWGFGGHGAGHGYHYAYG